MKHWKRFLLWLALGAAVVGVSLVLLMRPAPRPGEPGYVPHPGDPPWVWQATTWHMTKAQAQEWDVMMLNLRYGSRLAWLAGMTRAMLAKANWVADRLNLPIQRPIQESDVRPSLIGTADFRVLCASPSWIPQSIYGTNICNTNISRLQRILALQIGIGGTLDTPDFEFTFENGQIAEIVRQNISLDKNYTDRLAQIMSAPHVHPALAKTDEVYHIATNYLAAVGINLDMLEKSRLSHPVRQEEYQPDGASDSVPVYIVAWGTNFYSIDYIYHYWHTNQWHPAVTVELGPHNELLEMYVGDPSFFRDPPTVIPSSTCWRLVHTPDPQPDQLTNPAVMRELFLTPELAEQSVRLAHTPLWNYQHDKIKDMPISSAEKAEVIWGITNGIADLRSKLIPYKPGDDPVFDTNQP